MGMLATRDWYDIARQTNWTPKYAAEAEDLPGRLQRPLRRQHGPLGRVRRALQGHVSRLCPDAT
ncbi:MAG: hypothetical protein WDN31_03380 [Hyphomicrobium sp.]